jgi:hypothetical protein
LCFHHHEVSIASRRGISSKKTKSLGRHAAGVSAWFSCGKEPPAAGLMSALVDFDFHFLTGRGHQGTNGGGRRGWPQRRGGMDENDERGEQGERDSKPEQKLTFTTRSRCHEAAWAKDIAPGGAEVMKSRIRAVEFMAEPRGRERVRA